MYQIIYRYWQFLELHVNNNSVINLKTNHSKGLFFSVVEKQLKKIKFPKH